MTSSGMMDHISHVHAMAIGDSDEGGEEFMSVEEDGTNSSDLLSFYISWKCDVEENNITDPRTEESALLAQDGTPSDRSWRQWQPLARSHSQSTSLGSALVGSVRRWLEEMMGSGDSWVGRVMARVGGRCVGMWPLQVLVSALMVPAGGGRGRRGAARGGSRSRGAARTNAQYGRPNAPPPQQMPTPCPVRFCNSPNEFKFFLSKLSELSQLSRFVPNDRFEGMMTEGAKGLIHLGPASSPSYKEDDHYRVARYLGGGQFGEVHEVLDNKYSTKMAHKKVLLSQFAVREFEVLLEFGSSMYIPTLYGVILNGQFVKVFMEAAEMSWLDYIKKLRENNEPTRLSQLQLMIKDALEGLFVLHKYHVQHRDIKPGNLVLRKVGNEYVSMLVDFGEAITSSDNQKLTLAGTVFYLAPKAARGVLCLKDDVFSLGASVLCAIQQFHPWIKHLEEPQARAEFGIQVPQDLSDRILKEKDLIELIAEDAMQGLFPYLKHAAVAMKKQVTSGLETQFMMSQMSALLCSMLSPDDAMRISCEDALKHKLFNGLESRDAELRSLLSSTASARPASPPPPSPPPPPQQLSNAPLPISAEGVASLAAEFAASSLSSAPGSPMQQGDSQPDPIATQRIVHAIQGPPASESAYATGQWGMDTGS